MVNERKAYDDRQRHTGTLTRVHKDGYGFLEMGEGEPCAFVHRSQVKHSDWREGMRFSFILRPPKEGTSAPRADRLLPLTDAPRAPEIRPAAEVEL